jgi:hypothetical protein
MLPKCAGHTSDHPPGVHYTDYITKPFNPVQKRKSLSIKKCDLNYL